MTQSYRDFGGCQPAAYIKKVYTAGIVACGVFVFITLKTNSKITLNEE